MSDKPTPPKRNKNNNKRHHKKSNFTTAQYIVWTQNGSPLPESLLTDLDKALQRIITNSKVPVLGTMVKE